MGKKRHEVRLGDPRLPHRGPVGEARVHWTRLKEGDDEWGPPVGGRVKERKGKKVTRVGPNWAERGDRKRNGPERKEGENRERDRGGAWRR